MAFREDESRIRMGYGAENFAAIRNIALNLLKTDKSFKGSNKDQEA
jgi:predicted transposase YbfD/YdcC